MTEAKERLSDVRAMYIELDEAEAAVKKTSAKKVWKTVRNVLFAVIVALLLFCLIWVQLAKEKGETPELFGVSLSIVQTGSMEPTLPISSLILSVKVKDTAALEIGDIITFENPDGDRVVHRIHDKTVIDGVVVYVTKGDNNNAPDKWYGGYLPQDKIISKMVFKF